MIKQIFSNNGAIVSLFLISLVVFSSCGGKGQDAAGQYNNTPEVDFLTVTNTNAEVEDKYPGNIEGVVNVDIKPQVSGYLETIYVKEGEYVQKGQSLFKIKSEVFNEQVNNAKASLKSALANLSASKLEVDKMKSLVEGRVVSKIQLESAIASYDAASAAVAQAKAAAGSAKLNAEFSLVKAPVSGYISRIPSRIGNLVGPTDVNPLTTLSDIHEVFVYFSLSESEYISFMKENKASGSANRTVELIMADGSLYEHHGKLEVASGNIDRSTASISLKAIFPNPDKLLRAGGSAEIVLHKKLSSVLSVPMGSVKDIQDKFFVFALGDSNKVVMKPLEIIGKSGKNYLVKSGVNANDKIALTGIDVLNEGMQVKPTLVQAGK